MLDALSDEIPPVSRALSERGIPHRVFRHAGPVHTIEQAAAERGQEPDQVIRSILFRLGQDSYAMVLVAGRAQVSWPALRAYLGQSRLTTATEAEMLAVTGYERGAVAPFGFPTPMRILVDRSVLTHEEVSMGSGVRGVAVILRSADLLTALRDAEVGAYIA